MDIQAEKLTLIKWIVKLDDPEVIEQLVALQHRILQQDRMGDWDLLSDLRKERINKSIEQANAGLYIPAKEVSDGIRKKYGLTD